MASLLFNKREVSSARGAVAAVIRPVNSPRAINAPVVEVMGKLRKRWPLLGLKSCET